VFVIGITQEGNVDKFCAPLSALPVLLYRYCFRGCQLSVVQQSHIHTVRLRSSSSRIARSMQWSSTIWNHRTPRFTLRRSWPCGPRYRLNRWNWTIHAKLVRGPTAQCQCHCQPGFR